MNGYELPSGCTLLFSQYFDDKLRTSQVNKLRSTHFRSSKPNLYIPSRFHLLSSEPNMIASWNRILPSRISQCRFLFLRRWLSNIDAHLTNNIMKSTNSTNLAGQVQTYKSTSVAASLFRCSSICVEQNLYMGSVVKIGRAEKVAMYALANFLPRNVPTL